ncbi:MAG: PqiC family protein [Sneathiella sp.]
MGILIKIRTHLLEVVVLISTALFLVGCSVGAPSVPTQFYALQGAETSYLKSMKIPTSAGLQVGIGPIEIPGYADRSQIVSVAKDSKMKIADFDHWAEPVQNNIERILVSNISGLISSKQVFPYPASFQPGIDTLQVSMEIGDMIQTETGMVRLSVSWNIKKMSDNKLLSRESAIYTKQAIYDDYTNYASSLSELFALLAVDIVYSIEKSRSQ